MTTTAKKVPARLVARMVGFYGTIEAARVAYVAARNDVKGRDIMRGGYVLWVSDSGKIIPAASSEVFYAGSADARDVIPS